MSTMVLLNKNGVVERKLHLISPPNDFEIPEGMTLSWRSEFTSSSRDPLAMISRYEAHREPHEAYFYFGDAQGHVLKVRYQDFDSSDLHDTQYAIKDFVVTVQGTSASDVMALRDSIMSLVRSGQGWNVSNDLNPKPKRRWFGGNKAA